MTPLNKVGRELILDLINRTNTLPNPLTLTDVQLSAPVALDVEGGVRNTELTVYPAPGSHYIRSKLITYWRLDVSKLFVGESAIIGLELEAQINDTNDLIAILNERFGLQLTAEDVVYSPIDITTIPATFTMVMAEGSYGYIGSVELTFSYDLNHIIFNNLLDGLEYPSEPLIQNASPTFVNDNGRLLAGSGIIGHYMTTGDNSEAEIFVGVHKTGAGSAHVTPVNGQYDLALEDTRFWSCSFGVGLLDETRGSVFSDLYDTTLNIAHESGDMVEFTLAAAEGGLVWNLEGSEESIVDNEPTGSTTIAQNSQRTVFYNDRFTTTPVNGAGAHLGLFTITMTATPKQAIYVKPIVVTVTANITQAS